MNRNILSRRRCWLMILLVLVTCVPAFAQYTDGLGGNWNNPASATITNIIMDRYARRRLEKNLGAKRSGASSSAPASSSDSAAAGAKLNDASVLFRSTATRPKPGKIENFFGPGTPRVPAIMTAIRT